MEIKLAGVVVLYEPTVEVIDNINSYIANLGHLYIVDNSKRDIFSQWLPRLNGQNVSYKFCDGNIGVGPALNVGAKLAVNDNFEWLLTMDQDSSFDNIREMIEYIETDAEADLVGIYSPFHDTGTRVRAIEDITYEKTLMTSGNIVNLKNYLSVGGTDERYFVDCADHDLCLTMNENGFFVKRLNFCNLKHSLGNNIVIINGKEITNHSAFRRYYMTRNTLYLVEKHIFKNTRYSLRYLKSFIGNTLSCFRYESDRAQKLKFICLGFCHYLIRKKGSL